MASLSETCDFLTISLHTMYRLISETGVHKTKTVHIFQCACCQGSPRQTLGDTPVIGSGPGYLAKQSPKQRYHMGRNVVVESPLDAAQHLYQRVEAELEQGSVLVPGVIFYPSSSHVPIRDVDEIDQLLNGRVGKDVKERYNRGNVLQITLV